jgi:hypothetical protein
MTATLYATRSLSVASADSKVILGRPRICPARLKLTLTVMSIGLATEAGGGFQHADNQSNRSLSVFT